ncbi:MAG: hypothetical protein LQ342_002298 [Letrouitia transgressa]|nr:MAG: hypothetical protein LQ342_002298 [Letrouitia transgressa]
MYWPLGVPQVYSASKTCKEYLTPDDSIANGEEADDDTDGAIRGLQTSRNGNLFVTITETVLAVWQTSPIVLLTAVKRSRSSVANYGTNIALLLKPDASIVAVQTLNGFIVTYWIKVDPKARVYQQIREHETPGRLSETERTITEQERDGFREVFLKFRMVIKIDAGVARAVALDDELIVATEKPAALQCIRWAPDDAGNQTSTELVSRMTWLQKKSSITEMVHDRAMGLAIWITKDGRAYTVQRSLEAHTVSGTSERLFKGFEFHNPVNAENIAVKAAVNARFSLLAVGCANSEIHVYTAKDYVGNVSISHKLRPPANITSCGIIKTLSYSPDGYCLFAGYEHGWAIWSVYGKPGASSFTVDLALANENSDSWITSISNANWLYAGTSLLLTSPDDRRLWLLKMAKSATTSCFAAANISRTLLLTDSSLMVFRGYDVPTYMTITGDFTLWKKVEIPQIYLLNQRPIRSAIISLDGRYVAIAGRRGLAHYSINSGRWKTFEDLEAENAFVVRGGLCWYHHFLIAAVETSESYEVRIYSRELGLKASSLVFVQRLSSPAVIMALSGQDSLLVYTFENVLYHFIINMTSTSISLVQVGQLALNSIIRAPARVRAVTWILPDHQLRDGDPSQDVAHASVVFLVDAKLVLLQSTTNEAGLKYDMRVIANNVEYFDLMRDQGTLMDSPDNSLPESPSDESPFVNAAYVDRGLKDSLWYFNGNEVKCWMDVEDLLVSASSENERELPQPISIATDFYPSSVILNRGILVGLDADLTELFLPQILRRYLSHFDPSAASSLALRYQGLPYFSHALEMLLHNVLDDEVDAPPSEDILLPSVLSFLSPFSDYLDILVQCTRKTEVRSWRALFAHLPTPQELFEESLQRGLLKTAGGYLIVLQTFQQSSGSIECVRLLQQAKEVGDWDLCKELVRFLMALDESGDMLRDAVQKLNLAVEDDGSSSPGIAGTQLKTPRPDSRPKTYTVNGGTSGPSSPTESRDSTLISQAFSDEADTVASEDYFSLQDS